MMGVLGSEQQLCPCYKECQQFYKLVDLKDIGLVVYCHSTRRENERQGEVIASAIKDVFILQNTRGVKITTADLTSELEKKNISCPKCRKTFEHAQELMQNVPSIGRRKTIGVCDHCLKKAQRIKKPCFACEEIVKKFISVRAAQKEDTKKDVKIWLSRMGHLLKDTMNLDRPKRLQTRTYSDAQINQLFLKSPKSRREPEVQQMFCPETHKSYTDLFVDKTRNLKESNEPEKSVAFTQPIKPPETSLDFTSPDGDRIKFPNVESLSMGSEATIVGTHVPEQEPPRTSLKKSKQEDESSIAAKEAIKRRHDLSLRQMVGSEKSYGATSSRPEVYEILKKAPWEHPKPVLKDHDGISEIFFKLPKTKHDLSSESTSDSSVSYKLIKYGSKTSQKESKRKRSEYVADTPFYVKETSRRKQLSSKTSQKSLRDTRSEQNRIGKYDHGKLKKEMFDSELIFKKIKRDEHQLRDKEFKSERDEAKLAGEKAIGSKDIAENILKTQFSFFFPKKVQKHKKQVKVRSSQLIRKTQEKIRQQAENEQKRLEEEQQRKQEEKEKKMLAEEDKERRRQFVRDEKEYTVDMRMRTERKKSFDDLESKSFTKGEKQDRIKRARSKEDKYRTDRDSRDMRSESEFESKMSVDSGSVEKGLKQRTQPRDKMETGKMLKHKQDDEIEVVFDRTKHKDKTDRELEKSKRDLKSKSDRIDTFDDVIAKARKEPSSKTERHSEKSKGDLKSKTDTRDTYDDRTDKARKELSSKTDRELEKSKRDLKSKSDRSDTFEDVTDRARKEPSSETDRELEKSKRDLKSKSDRRDTFDDVTDRERKEPSSKTDKKDKYDEVSEKAKKGFRSKSGIGDKSEEVFRKEKETKKDYKLKSEQKDTLGEVSTPAVKRDHQIRSEPKEKGSDVSEKGKKGIKEKYETTDKDDEITVKSRKGKHDDIIDSSKKYPKVTRESKDKDIEITLKSKTGQQDITGGVVPEHVKKDLKSKTERGKTIEGKKDFEEEHKEKIGKEKKPKSEMKDLDKQMDKEMATALKNKEKQEREEKLQQVKEEKERLKLVEQLRKEKEAQKKQSTKKEAAETLKKSIKDKETLKKSEKSSKGEPKVEKSPEIEIPMGKIKIQESKVYDIVKLSTKPQDSTKKKGESPGEVQEPSRKPLVSKTGKETTEKESKDKGSKKAEISKEPKDKTSKKEETSKVDTESKEETKKKAKESADVAEFKKLQAQLKKDKEEALKRKKLEEAEAQKLKDLAEKRAKEGILKEAKVPKSPKPQLSEESTAVQTKINLSDLDPEIIRAHRSHKCGRGSKMCPLCIDSDLEIDLESYDNKINLKKTDITDIIIGEYILKYKPRREKTKETDVVPLLFKSKLIEDSILEPPIELLTVSPRVDEQENKPVLAALLTNKAANGIEPEAGKGIVRYALSDRTFIDKGWTMLPTEKVVRKMNVYRMRPAHPEFDWFEHNKNKRLMTYDTGERLAEFDDNGRGRWYYRSGRLALDYYDAEETNAQQRFVIYSSGEPDERGRTHPITILATFDYLGNGIVFDHAGKIRLKYNQTEGVVLDRGIGPVSHWKWHTLNDPPVLQQVMIDTQMAHKDPEILKLGPAADTKARPDNEEMLAIEFDNFIKEKSKKLSQKFKPFQIKMKALKINEHFSLKVLDQATIYLIFRDGTTNLKLNIGMILDHQEIVDTDTAEVGEVSNNLERFPARTDSLAGLQRSVAYAQRYERQRTERERRLRPPEPCASADNLTAAAAPPLRPPLRTMPTGSTSSAGYCNCRKPSNNLYYNTRLL